MSEDDRSDLSARLYQACLMEVLSPKPGNVAPGAEFEDSTVQDFVESARVTAPILARAGTDGVGKAIYEAVGATQQFVGHNTNLGILLLLAPLAAVPPAQSLSDGIDHVLSGLTVQDADWTYQAIRRAEPGGLGNADDQDVNAAPTATLRDCMALAADRDRIAAQYVSGFRDVLDTGLTWLLESTRVVDESQRITWLALRLLSEFGDSLIARKCGAAMSEDVRSRARSVLDSGWPQAAEGQQAYRQLNDYLRSDGNRLNPGTTADMIAAILFAGLRSGQYRISPDYQRQIQAWN